jgi:hypothetical protein
VETGSKALSFIFEGIFKIDYSGKLSLSFNCKRMDCGCRADMQCRGSRLSFGSMSYYARVGRHNVAGVQM